MSIIESLGYETGAALAKLLGRISGRKGTTVGLNKVQNIARAVKEFVNNHIDTEFTARELRLYVAQRVEKNAPGSADRIMRQLKKAGTIDYVLISRTQSLYKGKAVTYVGTVDTSNGSLGAGTDSNYHFRSSAPNGCDGKA